MLNMVIKHYCITEVNGTILSAFKKATIMDLKKNGQESLILNEYFKSHVPNLFKLAKTSRSLSRHFFEVVSLLFLAGCDG